MNETINMEKAGISLPLAVEEAFEVMAFIDVSQSKSEEYKCRNKIRIDIIKPFKGNIYLLFSDDLTDKIIGNIYGDDSAKLNTKTKNDCLLELMNIVAGNFMTFYFGASADYEMDLPEVDTEIPEQDYKNRVNCFFNAEGLKFRAIININ